MHSIENEDEEVFVVYEEDLCVGIAMYSLRFDYVEGYNGHLVGYLEDVYVDQNYRNKEIAR